MDGTGLSAVAANTLTSRVPFQNSQGVNAGFMQPASCTVLRVIADVQIGSGAVAGNAIWLIYIADAPGGATDLWNPTTSSNYSSKKCMGFRAWFGETAGFNSNYNPYMDIKTKRKIGPEQAIVFVYQANIATSLCVNLRVLIGNIG